MDYTTRELLKRYAKLATGQPFAPVLLNILVTSVCDMRCTHCFFTDELDDRPRKKLQMKAPENKQKAGAALSRRDAWLYRHVDEAIAVWDGTDPIVGRMVRSLQDHVGEDEVWLLTP